MTFLFGLLLILCRILNKQLDVTCIAVASIALAELNAVRVRVGLRSVCEPVRWSDVAHTFIQTDRQTHSYNLVLLLWSYTSSPASNLLSPPHF